MSFKSVITNADSIEHVNRYVADKALCLQAVKSFGKNIRLLWRNMEMHIDKEICMTALRNGGDIMHIPHQFRDQEMLELVFELKQDLAQFAEGMVTREMCIQGLAQGYQLEYIPHHM